MEDGRCTPPGDTCSTITVSFRIFAQLYAYTSNITFKIKTTLKKTWEIKTTNLIKPLRKQFRYELYYVSKHFLHCIEFVFLITQSFNETALMVVPHLVAHLDKGAPRTCTRRRRATCWGRPSTAAPPRAPVPDRRRYASPEGTTLSLRPAATRLRIHYRYTTLADLGGGGRKVKCWSRGAATVPMCMLWLITQLFETVP